MTTNGHHVRIIKVPKRLWPLFACAWGGKVLAFSITLARTIFIRKDCFQCQFGFHILEHEMSHVKLKERNEIITERETLKQTKYALIPILLSKPKMCKDCLFHWRQMYCEATYEYANEDLGK